MKIAPHLRSSACPPVGGRAFALFVLLLVPLAGLAFCLWMGWRHRRPLLAGRRAQRAAREVC
jgi:uncharacterized membrane protein